MGIAPKRHGRQEHHTTWLEASVRTWRGGLEVGEGARVDKLIGLMICPPWGVHAEHVLPRISGNGSQTSFHRMCKSCVS
eukprot:1604771-Alexandrium_andersonii.AAC.1